ncbi:MAG TPA: septum formation family protein [Candidatus Limnocylindrales bacterium]|nr:septum formation family protein [Candidatus Limnocylindrales bacterium]
MQGFLTGWGIRIAIIAVIVVGGLIFRDRLSGNAGELKVGDCFDDPGAIAEVSDVQHHPCEESHTSEVFFVGEMTGENASYPTDDAIFEFVSTNCIPAFASYTGKEYDGVTLDVGYFHPTSEGWSKGDRGMICYVYPLDGQPTTGSVKAAQ